MFFSVFLASPPLALNASPNPFKLAIEIPVAALRSVSSSADLIAPAINAPKLIPISVDVSPDSF